MEQERFVFREMGYRPGIDVLRDGKFYRGDVGDPAVARLLERCAAVALPKAVAVCVPVTHDEEGRVTAVGSEPMGGPVLDEQLKGLHRAFAYVATCGTELAAVDYENNDELRRALLGVCIAAMNAVVERMTAELKERFRLGNTAVLNPGSLPEWPLADQDKIFRLLGDVTGDTGVVLGTNHFMTPLVSGSGLLFETEHDYQNCTYCTNLNCVIRRAPYDPEKAAALRSAK